MVITSKWKGEGYWAFDIFRNGEKIAMVLWQHDKNKWIIETLEDADITFIEMKKILEFKFKKIGD